MSVRAKASAGRPTPPHRARYAMLAGGVAFAAIAYSLVPKNALNSNTASHIAPPASPGQTASSGPREQADQPAWVELDGKRIPISTGAAPGYVPDASCASCHPALYRTFQEVGMARSFYPPHADNVIEDFENNHYYHNASDRHYEMIQRNGKFYQMRYQLDEAGRRINVIEQRIDFIVGSGFHARTYLYRNAAGELYQLPLSWYTQSGSWGMSPGYDVPDHPGWTRRIERGCMFCHNAYPEVAQGSDGVGQPSVFPKQLPHGIGCQRCHGPAAAHVRVAVDPGSTLAEVRESVVNPARLDPQLRNDVCMQCHLQPIHNPESFVRIFGRPDYSYRPGQPLHEYMFYADYDHVDEQFDRFEVNHHPYRLAQSTCFKASGGRLGCLTCHDPHRHIGPTERAEFYRDRCLTCHSFDDCTDESMHTASAKNAIGDPSQEPGDCVACHMPKRRSQDAIQVVMTDHLIRRDPPDEDWTAPLPERDPHVRLPAKPYWPDRAPPEPLLSLYVHSFAAVAEKVEALPALQSSIAEVKPAESAPFIYLAQLQELAGQFRNAASTYRFLTQRFPHFRNVHTGLARTMARAGGDQQAIEYLRNVSEWLDDSPRAHTLLGNSLARVGQTEQAVLEFHKALQLRPNHVSTRFNLAMTLSAANRLDEAIQQFQKLLAIKPNHAEGYLFLSVVLVHAGRPAEAVRYARHALRLDPDHVELAEALAMALVGNAEYEAALAAADRAQELGADAATCLLATAMARHGLGHREDAERHFARALALTRRNPSDSPVRRVLWNQARRFFDVPSGG